MFKLVFKYCKRANFQWQLNYSCLNFCCLIILVTPIYAAPASNLTLAATTVASQAASGGITSKTIISIADLAQIQQRVLHQEFLKKLAFVEGQNSPQPTTPVIQKNSPEVPTLATKQVEKKGFSKINPKHQLRVLAIYGPLAQQTAEISFNGQSHIIANPTQLGWFKLLGIHHNKIFVQAFNPTQKPLDQATAISTAHSNPVYELLTGQQLEVQP